jgi:hypothetical protein
MQDQKLITDICNTWEAKYMPEGLKNNEHNLSAIFGFITDECGGLITVSNLCAAVKVLAGLEYERPAARSAVPVAKPNIATAMSEQMRESISGVHRQTGRLTPDVRAEENAKIDKRVAEQRKTVTDAGTDLAYRQAITDAKATVVYRLGVVDHAKTEIARAQAVAAADLKFGK